MNEKWEWMWMKVKKNGWLKEEKEWGNERKNYMNKKWQEKKTILSRHFSISEGLYQSNEQLYAYKWK